MPNNYLDFDDVIKCEHDSDLYEESLKCIQQPDSEFLPFYMYGNLN